MGLSIRSLYYGEAFGLDSYPSSNTPMPPRMRGLLRMFGGGLGLAATGSALAGEAGLTVVSAGSASPATGLAAIPTMAGAWYSADNLVTGYNEFIYNQPYDLITTRAVASLTGSHDFAYNLEVAIDAAFLLKGLYNISAAASKAGDNVASAGAQCLDDVPTPLKSGDFPEVRKTISNKQLRHIIGRDEYRGGGHLGSIEEAQEILDAYHSGDAAILGRTSSGFPVVRYDAVTGTNVNVRAGFPNQATNVFIIKGTNSPSVVPTNPNWSPKQ